MARALGLYLRGCEFESRHQHLKTCFETKNGSEAIAVLAYLMHTSRPSQNQSENSKKTSDYMVSFLHKLTLIKNPIFFYYRTGNGQNYPKSLFLNAFINLEIIFSTNWLQIFIIADKMGHFFILQTVTEPLL